MQTNYILVLHITCHMEIRYFRYHGLIIKHYPVSLFITKLSLTLRRIFYFFTLCIIIYAHQHINLTLQFKFCLFCDRSTNCSMQNPFMLLVTRSFFIMSMSNVNDLVNRVLKKTCVHNVLFISKDIVKFHMQLFWTIKTSCMYFYQ